MLPSHLGLNVGFLISEPGPVNCQFIANLPIGRDQKSHDEPRLTQEAAFVETGVIRFRGESHEVVLIT
jgi:hypothetical protein